MSATPPTYYTESFKVTHLFSRYLAPEIKKDLISTFDNYITHLNVRSHVVSTPEFIEDETNWSMFKRSAPSTFTTTSRRGNVYEYEQFVLAVNRSVADIVENKRVSADAWQVYVETLGSTLIYNYTG